jgi:hypothetical protein
VVGLDKWNWKADPEYGDAGWLRMGVDGSHQWQHPGWDVLVSPVNDQDSVMFQVRGSTLDGAMYPTHRIAIEAVSLVREDKGEVDG